MSQIHILGIDLSSQPENTAAWSLCWENGAITESRVVAYGNGTQSATDDRLHGLIARADVIGIDVPFGWPKAFREAMAHLPDWPADNWGKLQESMRLRATDIAVWKRLGMQPLSVSSDRIALPAMRAMGLLARHGVRDRSGMTSVDGRRFLEVYPAASLKVWGMTHRGYKHHENASDIRKEIVALLRNQFGDLGDLTPCIESDHILDALVAALTALLAHRSETVGPSAEHLATAQDEGWIHFPSFPRDEG